jgi:hypothetical protein
MTMPNVRPVNASSALPGSGTPSPVVPNAYWAVADWYVNPVSGSDGNPGTSASPVKTIMGGIVAKWGTQSPQLAQATTIHLLAAETLAQEAIVLSPQLIGGATLSILGTTSNVGAAFSPTGVTGKNRSPPTPQLLELTGAPAGASAGTLVHNATKDSYAFIDSVTGTTWVMTQPFTGASLTTLSSGYGTSPIEDDTWSTTDSYQRMSVPLLNLKVLSPVGGDTTNIDNNPVLWVQQVHVPDASGTPGQSIFTAQATGGCSCVFSMCWLDPVFQGEGTGGQWASANISSWHNGGLFGTHWWFVGGASNTSGGFFLDSSYLNDLAAVDGDIILHGGVTNHHGYCICGYAYVDAAGTSEVEAGLRLEPFYYLATQLWGPGTLSVSGGGNIVNESGTTWASCLTVATLQIDGATTGTSYSGGTWTDGRTVNAADLDTYSGLQNPKTGSRYSQ